MTRQLDQHPENPDNFWITPDGETVICAHCGREYPATGEDAFHPATEQCSDDCPMYWELLGQTHPDH